MSPRLKLRRWKNRRARSTLLRPRRPRPKPLLPVNPMSAPRAAPQKTETNAAAPDIGGRAGDKRNSYRAFGDARTCGSSRNPRRKSFGARFDFAGRTQARNSRRDCVRQRARAEAIQAVAGGRGPEGIFISGGNSCEHRSGFRAGHRAGIARSWQCAAVAAGSARAHRARRLEIAICGCGRGRAVRSEIGIVSAGSAGLETRLHAAREYAEFDQRVRQLGLEFCRAE